MTSPACGPRSPSRARAATSSTWSVPRRSSWPSIYLYPTAAPVRDLDGRVNLGGTALIRAKVRARYSKVRGRGCVALVWTIATISQAAVVADFVDSARWLAEPPGG